MKDQELLNRVHIAAPCNVDWNSMTGDERIRFCGQCKLNVYNISAMRTEEAASFIRENENRRVCLQVYRRYDGTIITDNCPVGLKKLRDVGRALLLVAVIIIDWLAAPLCAIAQQVTPDATKEAASRMTSSQAQNKKEPWNIRKFLLRFPSAGGTSTGPTDAGGHDVIQDKESQGPTHGPGPVQAWPVYIPKKNADAEASSQLEIEEAYSEHLKTEEAKLVLTTATLFSFASSLFLLWRKKKVSMWAIGGLSTIVLLVAGFLWGLVFR